MSEQPVRLTTSFHQKVWGVYDTSPWYPSKGGRVGEVCFGDPGSEPLPLLVKFIFTSERLSVQVHPDDEYAQAHEGTAGGKTEMWYILHVEPGAVLAAGFREAISPRRVREAALSGEIEQLLKWWPVREGQVFFIPAGTVHALGGGITCCEIQQNNPITYRLYDYGRPRELHLERAMEVAVFEPHPGPVVPAGNVLASCRHFVTERLTAAGPVYKPDPARFHLLVALRGSGRIGNDRFEQGETWHVPPGAEPFPLVPVPGSLLLRCYVP
jgi:mannose-6-phosphate isomerase